MRRFQFTLLSISIVACLSGTLQAKEPDVKQVPVAVSNPASGVRTDRVEIDSPFDVEKTRSVVVTDGESTLPAQLLGDRIVFVARDVPSMGCKLYWLKPTYGRPSGRVGGHSAKQIVVGENDFIRATIDPNTGAVSSLFEKGGKHELVPKTLQTCILAITRGETRENMTFKNSDVIENGPCRMTIRSDYVYSNSTLVQDIVLYEGVPRVDIKITIDWQEPTTADGPTLWLMLPMAVKDGKPAVESLTGNTSSSWGDVSCKEYGVAMFGNGIFRRGEDGTIAVLLVGPERPISNNGILELSFSIIPHRGGLNRSAMSKMSTTLARPMRAATSKKSLILNR